MKPLTKDEIRFVKETHFTPTVSQCDQYYLTTYTDEHCEYEPSDTYHERRDLYSKRWEKIIKKDAKEKYNVDLDKFLDKNLNIDNNDFDGISLEYVATYLFYCFFTKEELEKLTDEEATKFLQDYRYYGGFRKWDGGNLPFAQEAIEIYNGERVFYLQDKNVWNIRKDEMHPNSYAAKHILETPIIA